MSFHIEIGGELREIDAGQAELLRQMRRYPMEVLCGSCGGIGCELCEPEPPPRSRWARLRSFFRKERPK